MISEYRRIGPDKTLRELLAGSSQAESLALIGTPKSIVDEIEEAMDYVGGLMPELKKRGLARDKYEHELLRDNLLR